MRSLTNLRIGVDVGGTFTDAILFDGATGRLEIAKVPTTPAEVQAGTLSALDDVAQPLSEVASLVHGTTLVTNALIERKTAPIGLLTTRGFRDVLETRRTQRPRLYDPHWRKPPPLVPRRRRFEVTERVDNVGRVVKQLSEDDVRRAAQAFASAGIRDIAISFLFSFRNPIHEQQAAEILQDIIPDARVSLSSEVLPELREYERTSTTVLNAMARSIMQDYLADLGQALDKRSFTGRLLMMKADGGIAPATYMATRSVEAFGSGPAGGVSAATRLGEVLERPNILTLDMGGTTTDVSLIWNGDPVTTMEEEVEFGIPIRTPMVYIKSVGAGGGSILWLDSAGALRVGPHSAGADPGPACYGRGGLQPTLTDANLVAGRLDPDFFLGGRMVLQEDLATKAIERVGQPFGWSPLETTAAITRIAVANLAQAIREVSVDKGYDPRDFALLAFGGAGPIYAAEVASMLGIAQVIIPQQAGVFSALGCLCADHAYEHLRSTLVPAVPDSTDHLRREWKAIESILTANVESPDKSRVLRSLDMRYEGEAFEITVRVDADPSDPGLVETAVDSFHAEHHRLYGFARNDRVEIVNVRVRVVESISPPQWRPIPSANETSAEPKEIRRGVVLDGSISDVPVYLRSDLYAGHKVDGPAIVLDKATTTVIPGAHRALVDKLGNLIISADHTG